MGWATSKPIHPTMCSRQIVVDATDIVLELVVRTSLSGYSQTLSEIESEFYEEG